MAQPQGLNIPAIITTGIVTILATGVIIEGVRAVYAYEEPQEEARKWESVNKTTPQRLRDEQLDNLHKNTTVSIDAAMEKVIATSGKKVSINDKEAEVSKLIARCKKLTDQGQDKEAEKVVDQILAIDPKNEFAVAVKAILFDKASLQAQTRDNSPSTHPNS